MPFAVYASLIMAAAMPSLKSHVTMLDCSAPVFSSVRSTRDWKRGVLWSQVRLWPRAFFLAFVEDVLHTAAAPLMLVRTSHILLAAGAFLFSERKQRTS